MIDLQSSARVHGEPLQAAEFSMVTPATQSVTSGVKILSFQHAPIAVNACVTGRRGCDESTSK